MGPLARSFDHPTEPPFFHLRVVFPISNHPGGVIPVLRGMGGSGGCVFECRHRSFRILAHRRLKGDARDRGYLQMAASRLGLLPGCLFPSSLYLAVLRVARQGGRGGYLMLGPGGEEVEVYACPGYHPVRPFSRAGW